VRGAKDWQQAQYMTMLSIFSLDVFPVHTIFAQINIVAFLFMARATRKLLLWLPSCSPLPPCSSSQHALFACQHSLTTFPSVHLHANIPLPV
jgi:hypothetical protein